MKEPVHPRMTLPVATVPPELELRGARKQIRRQLQRRGSYQAARVHAFRPLSLSLSSYILQRQRPWQWPGSLVPECCSSRPTGKKESSLLSLPTSLCAPGRTRYCMSAPLPRPREDLKQKTGHTLCPSWSRGSPQGQAAIVGTPALSPCMVRAWQNCLSV